MFSVEYIIFVSSYYCSVCPLFNLVSASSHMSCSRAGEGCTEVRCCVELDIIITRIHVDAWMKLDPCQLSFSIGIGSWSYEWNFADVDVNIENTVEEVSPYLKIRYKYSGILFSSFS